jgi:hypothetical protein
MKNALKILFILMVISLTSCNVYRKMPKDKRLLMDNIVTVDSSKVTSEKIKSLILQRPNAAILGYPILADIYMTADQNPDKTYYEWIKRNKRTYNWLQSFISRKQIVQLQRYYKDINKTLKNIGKPPVYIDSVTIARSAKILQFYYISHSYLDASYAYQIDTLNSHKAKVNYFIRKQKRYIINKYEQEISSGYLRQLYKRNADKSYIKINRPYIRDDFEKEKERLTSLFRNKGVYHFQPSYINFNLVFDTINGNRHIETILNIPDRLITKTDTVFTEAFLPYRIKDVNIYISKDKEFDIQNKQDSIITGQMNIFSIGDKLRYKSKLLTGSVFIKKGDLYSDIDRLRTHRLLMSLQNFKQAYIQYTENKQDTTLTTNIFLIAEKRFSWKGSVDVTHSNIHDFGIKGGMSFSAKNIFKGAEVLNTSLYLMTATSKSLDKPDEYLFDVSELGADVTLKFPRILLPFGLNKYIPKYMLPKTYITFLSNTQTNIGLDRSKYAGIFGFEWKPIKERKFKIDLINYEFITNKKADNYFNIYTLSYNKVEAIAQELNQTVTPGTAIVYVNSLLQNRNFCQTHPDICNELKIIEERRKRITQNIFILSNKFDFYYDSRKQPLQQDFYLFNSNFELAGTILSPFKSFLDINENDFGRKIYAINNVPYAEYFKTDLTFVKHWQLHKDHILAYRVFFGYAVPYGNSVSIPFVSSYFAGGSNDIRGWRAYTLGPGTSGGPNEFNEANFKLTTNLEYRFPIAGYFKGAVFADAGNIWNINNDETDPKSKFYGLSSLKDIALATGFGLRVDFTYFIIRFDLAYKTYNPALPYKYRWINLRNTKLTDGVLNLGISYPF